MTKYLRVTVETVEHYMEPRDGHTDKVWVGIRSTDPEVKIEFLSTAEDSEKASDLARDVVIELGKRIGRSDD